MAIAVLCRVFVNCVRSSCFDNAQKHHCALFLFFLDVFCLLFIYISSFPPFPLSLGLFASGGFERKVSADDDLFSSDNHGAFVQWVRIAAAEVSMWED